VPWESDDRIVVRQPRQHRSAPKHVISTFPKAIVQQALKAVEFGVVCHTGATAGVSVFQATPGLSASDPSLGRRVAPWSTTAGLAAGAACILPPGELLALHGPYRRSEHQMEPGIAALNADLRSHTECAAAVAALGDDGAFWEMEALGTLENVVCHRAQDARLHV